MQRLKVTAFLLGVCLIIGCAVLTQQVTYVRIDQGLQHDVTFYGQVFSIPEKRHVSKLVLRGEGQIKNIEIHAKTNRELWQEARRGRQRQSAEWKVLRRIHTVITFPLEVRVGVETDAIRILQLTTTGKGRITGIELYQASVE